MTCVQEINRSLQQPSAEIAFALRGNFKAPRQQASQRGFRTKRGVKGITGDIAVARQVADRARQVLDEAGRYLRAFLRAQRRRQPGFGSAGRGRLTDDGNGDGAQSILAIG